MYEISFNLNVDCGTPASIENGVYTNPTSTLVDSEVTYSCNSGYSIVGKATVTCQSDTGTWTTAPGCQLSMPSYNYVFGLSIVKG